MAGPVVLRTVDVRLRLVLVAVLLTGCSAGASPLETCVEHSVEEGVDRAAARDACEAVVED